MLPLYPWAVERLSSALSEEHLERPIDVLVSSSSAAVKGIRPPKGVPHVCYCHAPARYIWGQRAEYGGGLRGVGLRLFSDRLRRWDRKTSEGVTKFVANSRHTAAQIMACFGREAEVVHPPVRTDFFTIDAGVVREDFWLVAGAIEPYKRADLAIRAARACGARLVIAGHGSSLGLLKGLADHRCEFLGRVSDEELRSLYRRARLLVFPQTEDFGIIAVEAQACGLPVLARRAGGALDTVIEGVTGGFFDEPAPAEIARAAARVPDASSPQTARACRENAERFGEAAFDEGMRRVIEASVASGSTAR
jgi:glycosyltransferase involved in cell wall biosynthesis